VLSNDNYARLLCLITKPCNIFNFQIQIITMKQLKYSLLLFMLVVVSTIIACKKPGVEPTPLTDAQKLAGTYKVSSATKDGADVTSAYSSFSLVLAADASGNASTYTVTEGTAGKPNYNSENSGKWQLLSNKTKFDFAGTTQVDLVISDIDNKAKLKFTWTMPESLDKTEPTYVMNLTKQ
jgi:hypothetical protein